MRRTLLLSLLLCVSALPAAALTPYLVKDMNPVAVPACSSPQDFVKLGALTLFRATDAAGTRVWRSDGTAAGTFPLPGCEACQGDVVALYAVGPHVFFVIRDPQTFEHTLWATAGTRRSTRRLLTASAPFRTTASLPDRGVFVFAAVDAQRIPQLWRSDGTLAGTYQLTRKTSYYDSEPQSFLPSVRTSGTLFFEFPADPEAGEALWKTDGTVAGTQLVRTFEVGGAAPSSLREVGGAITFVAGDDTVDFALWRSDGTAAGTIPLLVSPISSVHAGGGKVYFVGFDTQGAQLGVSDGTPEGTRLVTRFANASAFGPVDQLFPTIAGGRVYFPADDGVHGVELWTSDGTPGGTHLVADLCPGACSSGSTPLDVLPDGRLLVSATDGSQVALWTTSGGFSDFAKVKDFCAAGACSGAGFLADLGGKALLAASDGVHGSELWVSDGTGAGTNMLADLCPGSCGTGFLPFGQVGARTLLKVGDGGYVSKLVGTDGTPAGTAVLATLTDSIPNGLAAPRTSGGPEQKRSGERDEPAAAKSVSSPDATVVLGGLALFAGTDSAHGLELWRTDGTPGGTALVSDIEPRSTGVPSSFPAFLSAAGHKLFFFADDGVIGRRLWTSDETAAGTEPAEPPFLNVLQTGPAAAVGDTLFFGFMEQNSTTAALWKSDGTPGGTVQLAPEVEQANGAMLAVGSTVYFLGGPRSELWKTDGTPAGTGPVGAPPISIPGAMKAFAGRLLYFDYNELWSTDGTAAGTVLIAQRVGTTLAELDGKLYFVGSDFSGGALWSTDGTVAGTRKVVDFGPLRSADSLWVAGRKLYVFAERNDGVPVLVATDGTAAGTKRIPRVALASAYAREAPVDLGGRLFFRGTTQANTNSGALWVSDGTAAGTKPFLDASGHTIDNPSTLRLFAGGLVFRTADSDATSVRLWRSDGTGAGTRPLLTFFDPTYDTGTDLTVVGSHLFFSRTTRASGTELWALQP